MMVRKFLGCALAALYMASACFVLLPMLAIALGMAYAAEFALPLICAIGSDLCDRAEAALREHG